MAKKSRSNAIDVNLDGDPNEKQDKFLLADTKYVGYGGARGGGKSWSVRYKAVIGAWGNPGIKILIVRRTFPELRENHILPLMATLGNAAKYKDAAKAFEFPNGSRIKLGYIASDADITQYQGQEYDWIFIDEATQITEFQFNIFKACLRGVNDFPKRMYITCNPGGIGHGWVKRLFIDKKYTEGENANEYTFVQAKVYDNTALMEKDPEYVKNLESLPPGLKEAWLYGNWDAFIGQFFREYDPDIHVIKPFPIPNWWNRYRVFDYGFDMLACYWVAIDDNGKAYFYKELHENNLTIPQACKRIKEMNGDDHIIQTFAPPDMWRRSQDTGKSNYMVFLENGIPIIKAKNHRENGWDATREWLRIFEEKTPEMEYPILTSKLKIFNNCVKLIEYLPMLQFSKTKPNDAAKEPHDSTHSTDALRYFCFMRTLKPDGKAEYEGEPIIERYGRQVVAKTAASILGGRRPRL